MADQHHVFCYQHFTILKDQVLGHGSYGAVYKARYDQLMCAAKVLHPTIVDPYDPGTGKILQRFQQECDFLNHIRHPHIVQYLGVCQDPESKLPVLLMELLDSSLTKMLESSPHPIPYHIQVDLCSDVSLAVAYLHSNGIIHRDLSGNNVLVIAGRRAKVTDFGMSKITRSGQTSLTMCPGTLVYMSPESLTEPPRYTEKLDVFSQGVIMIQVCTRQFPNPGPSITIKDDPDSPTGMKQIPVLEPERRKNHIDLIDPTHLLLPIALDCLVYRERERPSGEELCQRLVSIKESQKYFESSQHTSPAAFEMSRILQQERDELARQVEEKTREIANREEQYQQDIAIKDLENEQFRTQASKLNKKVVDNEQVITLLQETNKLLQSHIRDLQKLNDDLLEQQSKELPTPTEARLEIKWRDGGKAPFSDYCQGMVVEGNVAYFTSGMNVYSYDSLTGKWNNSLPICPNQWGSLATVQGLLTMVGGWITSGYNNATTNKLFSLATGDNEDKWIEKFPPMPTSRQGTTATTYHNHLIVAGGSTSIFNCDSVDAVEVFNIDSSVWSKAASLPHPLVNGSTAICGEHLYMLGGNDKQDSCQSAFSCSLLELLQSSHKLTLARKLFKSSQPEVWQHITDTPMHRSTCVAIHGQLLAIGGYAAGDQPDVKVTAVYKYDQKSQSWDVISHIKTARNSCYVTVMDTSEMLVVGGYGKDGLTDSVEIYSIILDTVKKYSFDNKY